MRLCTSPIPALDRMPLYFFGTAHGDERLRDADGMDFPTLVAARDAAIGALPDITRDKLPDGDRQVVSIRVRNKNGTLVYSATLDLAGTWHVPMAVSSGGPPFEWCQGVPTRALSRMAAQPRRDRRFAVRTGRRRWLRGTVRPRTVPLLPTRVIAAGRPWTFRGSGRSPRPGRPGTGA